MKRAIFFVFLALFSQMLFAQELRFSGEAGSVWASALREKNRGDYVLGDTYLDGKLEAFYDDAFVFAQGRAGFDESAEESYCELKELYFDYSSSFWGFRIGCQKVAWGKADGIEITNIICPKDSSSLRSLFNDERLAIDTARLCLNNDVFTLDAYFIPFESSIESSRSNAKKPIEKNIKNADYAAKLSGYFSLCDVSLYAYYGKEADTKNMFGSDAAFPIGETVLRLESAYFFDNHKNLRSLIGLDWFPQSWTLTAQYFCDYCFDDKFNEQKELFGLDKYSHGATFNISKSLLSDTLTLSSSVVLMLNDLDSAIEVSGEYSLTDSVFLELGSYIFSEGKDNKIGTYGLYKDYTSAYLKARCVF